MIKNYMEQVARMLGVEIGERFKIADYPSCEFYINEEGLLCNRDYVSTKIVLSNIMTGQYEIVKIPKQKHTGLEEVQEGEWIYPLFDVVGRVKSAEERQLGTREFLDKKIRDNWARYIAIKKRLAKAASELNTEPIDWNNEAQRKWYIYYNGDLYFGYAIVTVGVDIHFTSEEAAQKAVEIVGKDDLIWMLRDWQPYLGYSTEVTG